MLYQLHLFILQTKKNMQNRIIKFRAWDKKQNYMAYQGTPDLETIQSFFHHFGDCELMQFTGLYDKDGAEIYEGDLLIDRYSSDIDDFTLDVIINYMPVVWCNKKLMWCIDASFKKDGNYLTSLVEYFGDFLDVGGNIYEHPHLITS